MSTAVHDVLASHCAALSAAWLKKKPERDADGNELP
jgi:hypothetical protein